VRILVSADDAAFAAFLEQMFRANHCTVDVPNARDETCSFIETREYDLAVLDLTPSDAAAFAMLERVRSIRPQLPILVLINRSQTKDSVRLLTMGADDFAFRSTSSTVELFARARAVLQRGRRQAAPLLRVQDLELDPLRRTVSRGGKLIRLTSKEYSLLEYLMKNAGYGVTREQIIEHAWNLPAAPHTNVVEVYINYLRKKVDGDSQRKLIQTIRGRGYRLLRSDAADGPPATAASA
jgi:two-component system, OmpR family, copper resistance phosphate regulon response regulator CusR